MSRIVLLIICLGIAALTLVQPVYAQSGEFSPVIEGDQHVVVDEVLRLPDRATTLTGTARPLTEIVFTLYAGDQVLQTSTVMTNEAGEWSLPIPAFATPPTRLVVRTSSTLPVIKIIETVSVVSVGTVTSFVLLQMLIDRAVRLLQILGLFKKRLKQGLIFDLTTKKPIPFVLMTIVPFGETPGRTPDEKHTIVSNIQGAFPTVSLPQGIFTIQADHPSFKFPVTVEKPLYVKNTDFYQGEPLTMDRQGKFETLLIPMEPTEPGKKPRIFWFNRRTIITILNYLSDVLRVPMTILSVVLVILYPTVINFIVTSLYMVVALTYVWERFQKTKFSGMVTHSGTGVGGAFVRVYRLYPYELASVLITDENGNFGDRLEKDEYQVIVTKDGFVADQTGLSFEVLDLRKGATKMTYTLTEITGFKVEMKLEKPKVSKRKKEIKAAESPKK